MKVVSVVGARPQFIKASPVSRALRVDHQEILVHTGQHYDHQMSGVFFDELDIPRPDLDLGIGSGTHGVQTGAMLGPLEAVLMRELPDVVVVYGDTNSTLAGALAAAKLNIPVAHVEAGLRSFDRRMPEELNRVVTDHLSDLLLVPTAVAVENLASEGIRKGVELVGDVMFDALRRFSDRCDPSEVLERFGLAKGAFHLATVHRAGNSDDPERLGAIIRAFGRLEHPVLWLVHPRTRENLSAFGLDEIVSESPSIQAVEPVSYVETISLLMSAASLLTDSGGMQKEAYLLEIPCVTLRDETEWVETVDAGWNVLTGADEDAIVAAAANEPARDAHAPLYGDGYAAEKIVAALEARYGS